MAASSRPTTGSAPGCRRTGSSPLSPSSSSLLKEPWSLDTNLDAANAVEPSVTQTRASAVWSATSHGYYSGTRKTRAGPAASSKSARPCSEPGLVAADSTPSSSALDSSLSRFRIARARSADPMAGGGGELQDRKDDENVRSYNDTSEVVGNSNDMAPEDMTNAAIREDGDAEGVVVNNSKGSCWTRRIRVGKSSKERDADPSRMPALEASMRAYADKKAGIVVNLAIGTSFDSVEEAYEFYSLHSWENAFGVRYAKSRLNVHRVKCMQDFVCVLVRGIH